MKNKFMKKLLSLSLCSVVLVGTAVTLPVFAADSNIIVSAAANVNADILVTEIKLSADSLELKKGNTKKLTAAITPSNAANKTIKWSTDKSYIASVDENGLVKANSVGTAVITAKTSSGKTASCTVTVYEELKNNSEVSSKSVTVGTRITLTGKASGGIAPYTYAYYYKKTTSDSWTAFNRKNGSAYSTKTTAGFNPSDFGKYDLRVNVKDSIGTVVQRNFEVNIQSKNPLKNNSFITSIYANPHVKNLTILKYGLPVTINASASGGVKPYKYAYYYKRVNKENWKPVDKNSSSEYTDADSMEFIPPLDTEYDVKVRIEDSSGQIEDKIMKVQSWGNFSNESTVSASRVIVGSKVTLHAAGVLLPGKPKAEFVYSYSYTTPKGQKYYDYRAPDKWIGLDKNDTTYSDTMEFTTYETGTYKIAITVHDERITGSATTKYFTLEVYDKLENISTVSASKAVVGDRITIDAKASGGASPYKYAYYYRKSGRDSWTAFNKENGSVYTTKSTAGFRPSDPGIYSLRVKIRDDIGSISVKNLTVAFDSKTPLKNESSISALTASVGKDVILTAKASGGVGSYKYAYYYKKSNSANWIPFNQGNGSVYSTTKSARLVLTAPGYYNLRAAVKDDIGTIVQKDFTVNIK